MIEIGKRTLVIGERINPTGRPRLAEQLRSGQLELVLAEARAQAEAGADMIDVNVGTPGVDETVLLPNVVKAVHDETGLPVCADSSHAPALVATLGVVPDLVINSVTGDPASMDEILPAIADSDAFLVGITKDHTFIPKTVDERIAMAERIVGRAESLGIGRERMLIDFLTVPVSAEPKSADVTLECVRQGALMGVGTVLGASNISFGMPERALFNSSFLSMAIRAGLSAAILNPLEPGLVQSVLAADVLAGRDVMARRFLKDYRKRKKS